MPENKLIHTLKDLGLTNNEAQVYFASLSLGPSTVLKIARAAQIKRTTVYSVVESLKNKGLLNIEIKGFKQFYVAENPAKLESMLDTKKQQLKNVLPEFSSLYNLKGSESLIKHYEGLEAVKTIYNDLLNEVAPHSDYRIVSDSEKWFELDPQFYKKFQERRAKKTFKVRILTRSSQIARDHKKREKNLNFKMKFLPKTVDLTINLIIVPHKVVLHQMIPPIMAIVIENKSVIHINQMMFDIIWDSIKN